MRMGEGNFLLLGNLRSSTFFLRSSTFFSRLPKVASVDIKPSGFKRLKGYKGVELHIDRGEPAFKRLKGGEHVQLRVQGGKPPIQLHLQLEHKALRVFNHALLIQGILCGLVNSE
ncbi:hypothetical protein PLEOSDRAFT_1109614 [Pleurotus ostreatus PC15]|uniref:Uncharacterized protein n=1 Tax=Pleurotus ostreatus (strain PC15) TaxID=1137138 RepID=A0A067N3A8_PLEO1|nr:hypothetical protein PLEOSDRAFT_1109614 [Pleurotus ostreatus PC15]